jgi:hypothetical protein
LLKDLGEPRDQCIGDSAVTYMWYDVDFQGRYQSEVEILLGHLDVERERLRMGTVPNRINTI